MRFGRFQRTIVFVIALIVPCGVAGSARASQVAADSPSLFSQFQSFVHDFPRWDMAHQNMPLIFFATTAEQNQPQALWMLWLMWMRDQQGTTSGTGGGSVATNPPPPVNDPPPGGGGNVPPGGGHTSGNSPEPSSLVLMGCGSLGMFAYRVIRSRKKRRG